MASLRGLCGSETRRGGRCGRSARPCRRTLAHLRDAGFPGAPLPFGVDEQGREVLSFVPGEVPHRTPESLGGAGAASLPPHLFMRVCPAHPATSDISLTEG